jgi:dTDP-4-dehydrorhamnose reductase
MWLLIGGDSEVGAAALRHLRSIGQPALATTRRSDRAGPLRPLLDLGKPFSNWEPPAGVDAACIFAAVARLATCQADPGASTFINVTQTLALTKRLVARGCYVLFLSTNQVFDGTTPHVASDAPTSPTSEYGRQKARAEALLRQLMQREAPIGILRLAKVTSLEMPLLHGWLDALSAGKPIRAFSDMTMAPTPMVLVTEAIAELMRDRASGIFQLTGAADAAYADIALHLAGRIGAPSELVEITSAAAVGMPPGSTPRHTTLDSSALHDRFGIRASEVWPVIDEVLETWQRKRKGVDRR